MNSNNNINVNKYHTYSQHSSRTVQDHPFCESTQQPVPQAAEVLTVAALHFSMKGKCHQKAFFQFHIKVKKYFGIIQNNAFNTNENKQQSNQWLPSDNRKSFQKFDPSYMPKITDTSKNIILFSQSQQVNTQKRIINLNQQNFSSE